MSYKEPKEMLLFFLTIFVIVFLPVLALIGIPAGLYHLWGGAGLALGIGCFLSSYGLTDD